MSINYRLFFHRMYVTLRQKKNDMKAMYVSLVAMTIALAACSGSGKSQVGDDRSQVGDLPVVAHSVEVNGQEMTVCNLIY